MRVMQYALTAGARTPFHVPGRFFMLIETAAELDVEFESAQGATIGEDAEGVEAGFKSFPGNWADPDDHKFTAFVLTSASAQTVKVAVSSSAGDYLRAVSVVEVQQADTLSSTADETVSNVAEIVAATNTARKTVTIQNVHASENARIGDSSVTASRGLQLQPGQSVTFTNTAAIYAIREGSADTTVAVVEETK